MVPDHWSNDAMVSMDRCGLLDTLLIEKVWAQNKRERKEMRGGKVANIFLLGVRHILTWVTSDQGDWSEVSTISNYF